MFNIKPTTIVVIVLVILLGLKFWSLSSDLDTAEQTIANNTLMLQNKTLVIQGLENSVTDLNTTIDRLNEATARYKSSSIAAKDKLDKWLAKSKREKFLSVNKKLNPDKVDYAKTTCEEGLALNKRISELSYDEL